MPSQLAADPNVGLIRELLQFVTPGTQLTLDERRQRYDRAARTFRLPPGTTVETAVLDGVPAEWLRPSVRSSPNLLLYFHGGAYALGSARSHRHLAAALAEAGDAEAVVPDYRRAPEHPFPAAVDDAVAVYCELLRRGHAPASITIAGDSAGGGLTLACALRLRDAGTPLPRALVCLSPWVDLTCSGGTYATHAHRDPLVNRGELERMAAAYLGDTPADHPLASPLFADLRSLPPLLIHAGENEVLLGDSTALHAGACAAGSHSTLEVYPAMIHVWHWYAAVLPAGTEAIGRVGAFMRTLG